MTSDTRQLLVILPQSGAALKRFSDSLVINGSLTKLFLASANIKVKMKSVDTIYTAMHYINIRSQRSCFSSSSHEEKQEEEEGPLVVVICYVAGMSEISGMAAGILTSG